MLEIVKHQKLNYPMIRKIILKFRVVWQFFFVFRTIQQILKQPNLVVFLYFEGLNSFKFFEILNYTFFWTLR